MMTMKNTIAFGLIMAFTIGSGIPASHADENELLNFARSSAKVAGSAQYCKADEDMIDEFIAKAEARLAILSKDDYEKVLGKLEFKNVLAGAAAREPEEGCDAFVTNFEDMVRRAR
ncbi:hypothetical protein ACFO5Q_18535 [Kordiimonas lipolytica]|uniref:Uncharacterized protein n=1 Tax=Kordiimonas lipolytica TaxID=1662421 RepID=A0ABV8UF13_9PROT|nr:hypothetical protein [Kordiimonas lipolytica]